MASTLHLLRGDGPTESLVGTVIAAASVPVLSLLAFRKRWVAVRIPSRALLGDAHLSAVGAALAGLALIGTGASAWFGWWWADAVAALGVACMALRLGIQMARNPDATEPLPTAF
jgi:divalent metal cation (Fe/Co/Zn/Cd) transporter